MEIRGNSDSLTRPGFGADRNPYEISPGITSSSFKSIRLSISPLNRADWGFVFVIPASFDTLWNEKIFKILANEFTVIVPGKL